MPPKGRGRKRSISAANLVEEIRAEVDQSITSETAALEAYRVLTSTSMSCGYNQSITNQSCRDVFVGEVQQRCSGLCILLLCGIESSSGVVGNRNGCKVIWAFN